VKNICSKKLPAPEPTLMPQSTPSTDMHQDPFSANSSLSEHPGPVLIEQQFLTNFQDLFLSYFMLDVRWN
jgi:hypothetical protein